MLKNNRLLYILPEMAFTATVGETPKQDYYFVSAFHQINGEFMKEENFVFDNLKKLFERIEEDTYTLVLPDFLFTDTIVNVPETDDVKIAEHLRDQLLPRIEVSTFSHETRTSVLIQRKTTAKVQLSAFEKELAAAIKLAIGSRQVKVEEVVPLSWVLKAAVSLEPSLTITQMGERLYLAEHYVGINQTVNAPLTDLDIIAETVKTLKGSDPNLQTAYLFTSVLVEERLKEFLTKTLPVQQLTKTADDDAKIPSYVKQVVEVSARTLSLSEFAVPRFSLEIEMNLEAPPVAGLAVDAVGEKGESKAEEEQVPAVAESEAGATEKEETPPETPASEPPVEEEKEEEKTEPAAEEVAEVKTVAAEVAKGGPIVAAAVFLPTKPAVAAPVEEQKEAAPPVAESVAGASEETELPKVDETAVSEEKVDKSSKMAAAKPEIAKAAPELSFMKKSADKSENEGITAGNAPKAGENDDRIKGKEEKKLVSKKKGGMGSFFKKLFLFLLIFVITIALGIAVGLGILALTGKNLFSPEPAATPEPTFLPTPVPTPEPTPVATTGATTASDSATVELTEEDKAEAKILVVNATGVAGIAGQAKTALEKDGFTGVQTGNAKGTYDESGVFVLMKEKNSALIAALETATGETLTYDEDYAVEDTAGTYTAVIVLNNQE